MTISPTQRVLGQDTGFAHFVAGEQVALRRHALALTGNGPDADDLLQATLVKVYLVWDRLSDRDHLGGYARTTMTRTHVSLWRSWGRREVAVEAVPETSAPPTSDAVERDLTPSAATASP